MRIRSCCWTKPPYMETTQELLQGRASKEVLVDDVWHSRASYFQLCFALPRQFCSTAMIRSLE